MIKERVLHLSVTFAAGPLKRNSQFAVRIFDRILGTSCPAYPESSTYTEAVKDLLTFCAYQMQRLAMKFPNDLLVSLCKHVLRKFLLLTLSRQYMTLLSQG